MNDSEFNIELALVNIQLSKEKADRERIARHARETNNTALSTALVVEGCKILERHAEFKRNSGGA